MPEAETFETFDAAGFRRRLQRWYRSEGRHELPWRMTRDPYAVLVSEVMLQQTQVERVLPYYEHWLERWPSFAALAKASPAEVIREWAGLGYNRRALNLQRTATAVVNEHGGKLPSTEQELAKLPGIGPYTASAIRSFAFEARTTVVDTNIGRVIARPVLGVDSPRATSRKAIIDAAEQLLPPRDARGHNLALMDLGAMVCRARAPGCERCPVAGLCRWRIAGQPMQDHARAPSPRFESTSRFARGRIIEALRVHRQLPLGVLGEFLPAGHRPGLEMYLAGLEADGLVERAADGSWRLPEPATAG